MINTEEIYDDVGDQLLQRRGKRFSRELKDRMMGRPGAAAIGAMINFHRLTDSIQTLQRESEDIFRELLPTRLAPMPGLIEILDRLDQASIPKAIATSSRRRFVNRILSLLKIKSTFQFILTAEDVTRGKPDPEIYTTAANRFELSPEHVMALEDSETGSRAAVAAKTCVIAVPGRHSRHHDFSGVQFIAESLSDARIYETLGLGSGI